MEEGEKQDAKIKKDLREDLFAKIRASHDRRNRLK